MRTSAVCTASLLMATCLVPTAALATSLVPDPTFGDNGRVRIWLTDPVHAQRGHDIVVVGAAFGGGSGEHFLRVHRFDDQGVELKAPEGYGWFHTAGAAPKVSDVVIGDRLVYVVGYQGGGIDETTAGDPRTVPAYFFAAAFTRTMHSRPAWGSDRFLGGQRGLEKLRSQGFTTLTSATVDRVGRMLVAGTIHGQTAVLRLTRNGHVDRSYGDDGLAMLALGDRSAPRDMAASGSSVVVAGNASFAGGRHGYAAKLTSSGRRDRSWGGNGVRRVGPTQAHVASLAPANSGRWLIAYERSDRAVVAKVSATGAMVRSYGRHGRTSMQCRPPRGHFGVDDLTTHRRKGRLTHIALAASCRRGGEVRRLVAIWEPNGTPAPSLEPDAVGRLPWTARTRGITYGPQAELLGLTRSHLVQVA